MVVNNSVPGMVLPGAKAAMVLVMLPLPVVTTGMKVTGDGARIVTVLLKLLGFDAL